MNYTNEEILKAVELIHNICDTTACPDCPFEFSGDCMIHEEVPHEWKITGNGKKWCVFYK